MNGLNCQSMLSELFQVVNGLNCQSMLSELFQAVNGLNRQSIPSELFQTVNGLNCRSMLSELFQTVNGLNRQSIPTELFQTVNGDFQSTCELLQHSSEHLGHRVNTPPSRPPSAPLPSREHVLRRDSPERLQGVTRHLLLLLRRSGSQQLRLEEPDRPGPVQPEPERAFLRSGTGVCAPWSGAGRAWPAGC